MAGALHVGTSGFSYAEWKPDFYPADLPQKRFLEHYASVLDTVEINNTFYRSPSEALLRGWVERTPEHFLFTLKAPRSITHMRGLADVDEPLSRFLEAAKILGDRLGMILFQCPPKLAFDAELLSTFLAGLPGRPFRFAMEFRHPSWNTEEVHHTLGAAGVAWCVAETEDDQPLIRTAKGFAYLRLRRDDYDHAALQRWASAVRDTLEAGTDVYAYFKHEDEAHAPRYAQELRALIEA